MNRIPPALQAQIDAFTPLVRQAFLDVIVDIRSEAQLSLLVDAISRGDMRAVEAILGVDPAFFAPLDRTITNAYYEGAIRALAGLPVIPDPAGPGKSLSALTGATRERSNGRAQDHQP